MQASNQAGGQQAGRQVARQAAGQQSQAEESEASKEVKCFRTLSERDEAASFGNPVTF